MTAQRLFRREAAASKAAGNREDLVIRSRAAVVCQVEILADKH